MKIDLYIDFDGVILDTIEVASNIYFSESNHDGYPPREFYENLDWSVFLAKCHEINNSIVNINKLMNSGLFNVRILTHYVCDNEKIEKIKYLKNKLSDIEVITVYKDNDKNDVVDAKGSILVDDYTGNLDLWNKAGGISIKFSTKNNKYNYMVIDNLGKLIDFYPKLMALVKEKSC